MKCSPGCGVVVLTPYAVLAEGQCTLIKIYLIPAATRIIVHGLSTPVDTELEKRLPERLYIRQLILNELYRVLERSSGSHGISGSVESIFRRDFERDTGTVGRRRTRLRLSSTRDTDTELPDTRREYVSIRESIRPGPWRPDRTLQISPERNLSRGSKRGYSDDSDYREAVPQRLPFYPYLFDHIGKFKIQNEYRDRRARRDPESPVRASGGYQHGLRLDCWLHEYRDRGDRRRRIERGFRSLTGDTRPPRRSRR